MRVKTISPARNEPSSSRCLRMGSVDSRPAQVIGADLAFIGAVTSGYSCRPAASQTVAVYATGTGGVACKYPSGIVYRYPRLEPAAEVIRARWPARSEATLPRRR